MSTPKRAKVGGDLYHGVVPEGAVYIGRAVPGLPASQYANPYSAQILGHDGALRLYREHLRRNPELIARARHDLAGKDLACWCSPEDTCHGDLLLRVVAGEDL